MNDLDTLLAAWVNAERAGDTQATDRLLTDDFVGIGPLGFVLPKAAWLQRQMHYDDLGLDDVNTRRHGDCAITTARWNAKGTAQGHPIPEAVRVTLVSVDDQGDWRLAGVHYSFIAGTPGAPGPPGRP
jgi:ketosteroid isomerase-like protein